METFRDLQSFYKTTLSQSISASDGTIIVAAAPAITTGYLIIEPNTANEEIVLMTNAVTTTLTVTRGLATSGSSEAAGTGKAHPAGVAVIIADAHYYIKKLQVSKAFQFRGAFADLTAINAITNPEAGDLAVNLDNGFTYYYNGAAWAVTSGGSAPADASTTTKGISKMSVAPASATNPIAVGDNDPRVPTQNENDAAQGSVGTPSNTNRYLTQDDAPGTGNILRVSELKFGGTGADGALTISSGTTTLDLAGAAIFVKNYSSISITGTGALAFMNPHANGTTIVLKCSGNVVVTSSANPAIDLRNLGGIGGTGGGDSGTAAFLTSGAGGGYFGMGGGGIYTLVSAQVSSRSGGQGGGNLSNGSIGQLSTAALSSLSFVGGGGFNQETISAKTLLPLPGGGGGGGLATTQKGGAGGAGGRGAGALRIECKGSLEISSVINASGTNGSIGTGCGGGGAGGTIQILYTTLVSNTGTYTVTGGAGGTGGALNGGAGSIGQSFVGLNTE